MKPVTNMNRHHTFSRPFRRFAAALVFSAGLFGACNQDPIFYDISMEVILNDPKIPGTPTPIAADTNNNKLYISNGRIFVYEKPASDTRGFWQELPAGQPPGGNTRGLALAGNALYALTLRGTSLDSAVIYALSLDSAVWIPVSNPSGYNKPQSLFGAGDYLFVGALSGDSSHALLYLGKGDTELKLLADRTVTDSETGGISELRGAVFFNNQYYIATAGHGIYKFDKPEDAAAGMVLNTASALPGSLEAGNFIGLLPIDSAVYGFTGGGSIWKETGGIVRSFSDVNFTGALGIWQNPADDKERFLLIGRGARGITSVSYTYGYYELVIADGELKTDNLFVPGSAEASSVKNHGQYVSSLQKNALNGIYQVPWVEGGDERPIFASSQLNGLWSYRKNGESGNMEWNIED
jgi:hypothetical protein